ncbi:Uncharacterised protein [Salmonella enterica]|nr:Uncharacterised protein [Salmonella enterica]
MGISLQIYRKCNKNVFSIMKHIKNQSLQIPHIKSIKQLKPTAGMVIKLIKKLKTIKHLKTI